MMNQPHVVSKLGIILCQFILGAVLGLVISAVYLLQALQFHTTINRIDVIGCLFMAISCGLVTTKWGCIGAEAFLSSIW